MPLKNIYSDTINGGIYVIGNSVGLSKRGNLQDVGTLGSIGAFITLDECLRANNYPYGTTLDYKENSSAAILQLNENTEIEYAYIIWSSTYLIDDITIEDKINDGVKFNTPKLSEEIHSDSVCSFEEFISIDDKKLGRYVRGCDVTEMVKYAGEGIYSLGKIPCIIDACADDVFTNNIGWSLAVIYKNKILPPKKIDLYIGMKTFYYEKESKPIRFPKVYDNTKIILNSKMFLSALGADARKSGKKMLFGYKKDEYSPMSGINNPENNFLASQINNENGELCESGTFGYLNHDAIKNMNNLGARQGWDITAVNIKSVQNKYARNAFIRFEPSSDVITFNLFAFESEFKNSELEIKTELQGFDRHEEKEVDMIFYIKNTADTNITYVEFEYISSFDYLLKDLQIPNAKLIHNKDNEKNIFKIEEIQANEEIQIRMKISVFTLKTNMICYLIANYDLQLDSKVKIKAKSTSKRINLMKSLFNMDFNLNMNKNLVLAREDLDIELNFENIKTYIENVTITPISNNVEIYSYILKLDENKNEEYNFQNKIFIDKLSKSSRCILKTRVNNGELKNSIMFVINYIKDGQKITYNKDLKIKVENIDLRLDVSNNTKIAKINDKISYFIDVYNNSKYDLCETTLSLDLPNEFRIASSSVILNDLKKPQLAIDKKILINNIRTKEKLRLKFDAVIGSSKCYDECNVLISTYINIDGVKRNIVKKAHIQKSNIYDVDLLARVCSNDTYKNDILKCEVLIQNKSKYEINKARLLTKASVDFDIIDNFDTSNNINMVDDYICIDKINSYDDYTLNFDVKINNKCEYLQLMHSIHIGDEEDEYIYFDSNEQSVFIEKPSLIINKKIDKRAVFINEELECEITIKNIGNVDINNVAIKELLPIESEYVKNSFYLNGVNMLGVDLSMPVKIEILRKEEIVHILYKVKMVKFLKNNVIFEKTKITANLCDLNKNISTLVIEGEDISLPVYNMDIGLHMNCKKRCKLGDNLPYEIIITNNSNTNLYDVMLECLIPGELSFIKDSLQIDGVKIDGIHEIEQINVGNLIMGGEVTVSFVSKVNKLSSEKIVKNKVLLKARGDANGLEKYVCVTSNETYTNIEEVKIQIAEEIDKNNLELDDEVTYRARIKNIGTGFIEKIEMKALLDDSIEFVKDSLVVNNVNILQENITDGITIEELNVGETLFISFRMKCSERVSEHSANIKIDAVAVIFKDESEDIKLKTEDISIRIIAPSLKVTKWTDKSIYLVGENINYFLEIENIGNERLKNVYLKEIIPGNITYIENSLKIEGMIQKDTHPKLGIKIGDLEIGDKLKLSFEGKIKFRPKSGYITEVSKFDFKYKSGNAYKNKIIISEELKTKIDVLDVEVVGFSDMDIVSLGDEFSLDYMITNNSSINIDNLIFRSSLPDGTYVVPDTTLIDGVEFLGEEPTQGIIIEQLSSGDSIRVNFKVQVLPHDNNFVDNLRIDSKASIEYSYLDDLTLRRKIDANDVYIQISTPNFKIMTIDGNTALPQYKPDLQDVLNSIVDVDIVSTHIVKTAKSESVEGRILTGVKVIIQGNLKFKVEYLSSLNKQQIYLLDYEEIFNTSIILPENVDNNSKIHINPVVEDVYVKYIDPRTIFKNITLRLEAMVTYY